MFNKISLVLLAVGSFYVISSEAKDYTIYLDEHDFSEVIKSGDNYFVAFDNRSR